MTVCVSVAIDAVYSVVLLSHGASTYCQQQTHTMIMNLKHNARLDICELPTNFGVNDKIRDSFGYHGLISMKENARYGCDKLHLPLFFWYLNRICPDIKVSSNSNQMDGLNASKVVSVHLNDSRRLLKAPRC